MGVRPEPGVTQDQLADEAASRNSQISTLGDALQDETEERVALGTRVTSLESAQSGSASLANCLWDGSAWTHAGATITARPSFAGKLIWLGGGADQDPTPAGLGYAANGDLWIPSEVVE